MSRLKNENVHGFSILSNNNNKTDSNSSATTLETNDFANEIKWDSFLNQSSSEDQSLKSTNTLILEENNNIKSSTYSSPSYSMSKCQCEIGIDNAEDNVANIEVESNVATNDNLSKKSISEENEEEEELNHETDDKVLQKTDASIGTNISSEDASDPDQNYPWFDVAILSDSSHQLNLKPILKRKDSLEPRNQTLQTTSILPPILKKRDSLNNDNIGSPQHCVHSVSIGNAQSSQPRPLSILKNRQPKGSCSFDEQIGNSDIQSPTDDNSCSSGPHLKPILKKKSWSTEESVQNTTGSFSEAVKGILKSSDKSTSSTSSSSKNSILDEAVSLSAINTATSNSDFVAKSASQSLHQRRLKGILKSSPKNQRSTSLSPCTSTDSLVLEDGNISVGGDGSLLNSFQANYRPTWAKQSAYYRKRTSLDNDSITSLRLFDYESSKPSNIITSDNPQMSVIDTTILKPILKRNSFDSPPDGVGNSGNDIPDSPIVDNQRSQQIHVGSIKKGEVLDSNKSKPELRMASTSSSSSPPASSNGAILRSKITTVTSKIRPKSCIVGVGSSELTVESDVSVKNSISERLALLRQNGEEAWRRRLQKEDMKESKNNAIANRLSLLMESQSQWKNRVPEKDAKQFTVASKLNQTKPNTKTDEKVVLRETPKRLGLRGSTLSEKKLGAISSKLNNVLSSDRSPFSPPSKSKKEPVPIETKNLSSEILDEKQKSDMIYVLKPDDEESFGSFFGLDNSTMEQVLKKSNEQNVSSLDSIDNTSSSIKLLTTNSKPRVQAPKRRAASERNPMRLLAKSTIAVNSNQPNESCKNVEIPISKVTKKTPAKDDPKFAISALAGLASTEDFKSVANKLRNSSNGSLARNDSWRSYDLKNSLQPKMLILVKGRRKAHIRLVEPSWQSLNQMDSFILVTKDKIFAYIGRFSNIIERTKCLEISELIRKRKELCFRSFSSEVVLIDCQNSSWNLFFYDAMLPLLKEINFPENARETFDQKFSLTTSNIDLDEDDEFYEECINHTNMVYSVVFDEKSDKAHLKELENNCGRSPRHQILQQDQVLIFDFGSEMYIWLGKVVSNAMRKKSVEVAKELWLSGYDYSEFDYNPFGEKHPMKSEKRPDWAWFIRVNQNMEPILFKDKFFNWPAFTLTRAEKKCQKIMENVSRTRPHKCVKKDLSAELNLFPVDVETDMIKKLPKEPQLILECVSLGRGAGDIIQDEDGLPVKVVSLDLQCFYIDDFGERIELEEKDRNFLCSGESYYIRWKYRLTRISRSLKTGGESRFSEDHGGRDRVCYFVWQGKEAKNTKRGITALNAIEKLRIEGASQTYIEHGNEDPVFLRIFQGSLVIQIGKRNQIPRKYRMFMLKDTEPTEEFLVELDCSFRNLRSRTSYAFINPDNSNDIFIWHGVKTTELKRQMVKEFVEKNILNPQSKEFGFTKKMDYRIIELNEGKETKMFLEIFNSFNPSSLDSTLKRSSKSNLQRDIYFSLIDDPRPYNFTPRLFHFVTSSDHIFEAVEIVPSYLPSKKSNIVNYPFVQGDIYERAKSRPTFFLLDAEYEVFLWESKYPFFISNDKKDDHSTTAKDGDGPKMIDIEKEIESEMNTTTGFMCQLWLAERKCALETTLAYSHAKNSTEPPKSYVISAGLEPDAFCGLFPTWTYYDNVAKLHIQDGRKPGEQILVQEILSQIEDINQSNYSYEELKRRPLPEGINILCLESYLDDEEFEKVFSMNREEFCSLPTWKQKIIKQEKGLF